MKIPKEVSVIIKKLEENKYEAYIVGGCVRDLLMDNPAVAGPKDWDITTNAKPEDVQKIFPDSFYENQFGTVGVKIKEDGETNQVVEVTTYRIESKYSDKRHPDEIKFAQTLAEDLGRRDFTVNAMALRLRSGQAEEVVDLFGGQNDLKDKIIRTVGSAIDRFDEDALRMMRAIRFATVLNFSIEKETLKAISERHELLKMISKERIRDELIKIINSENAKKGIELLEKTQLMKYVIPELSEGIEVGQNLHHIYTVWEHNLRALEYACNQNYSFEIRLASLLHDVGKPKSKRGEGYNSTFYGHEVIGAKITAQILDRLKFPKDQAEKITKLVRYHLFYYNPGEVTETSVRRLVANIGKENVEDLIKVREADRIGSGVPKAKPYKLRHLEFMIDKVARDPISPKMLKLKGGDIMKLLEIEAGPKVGLIINALMNEVLDDPKKNRKDHLENRTKELNKLSELELLGIAKEGKTKIGEEEEKEVGKIKKKYFVQ